MAEQICVIKEIKLGYDIDVGTLTMRFAAYATDATAALQIIQGEELEKAFKDTHAPNPEWFKGKACWCEVSAGTILYKRMYPL